MGILLVIIVIVAVAGAAYYFNQSTSTSPPPATPLDSSLPSAPTIDGPSSLEPSIAQPGDLEVAPIEQTTLDPAPLSGSDEVIEGSEGFPAPQEVEEERPDMNSTPANDGAEDGIKDAYFAKKVIKKERTLEASGSYDYTFVNLNNVSDSNRATIAQIIESRASEALEREDRYVLLADVLSALKNETYDAGATLTVPAKKIQDVETYERINSAPLESIVYVFVKTINLDGKQVTVNLHEKDPLLVEENAALPVLEVTGTDGEEEDGAEITDLIAPADEGTFVKKIKLRPKSDEDLKEWVEKLEGGAEDGLHTYSVGGQFTVEGDADTIADTIKTRSDEALAPDHTVKKEDILEVLVEGTTYAAGQKFVFPKYSKEKNIEKLWLRVLAQGNEESYDEEFLNESDDGDESSGTEDNYFIIGGVCQCELKVRAFMRMLKVKEGVVGEKGYSTMVGGGQFSDFSDHPFRNRSAIYIRRVDVYSTASGGYQMIKGTWDYAVAKAKGDGVDLNDFSPLNQDLGCIMLMKYKRRGDSSISDGGTGDMIQRLIDDDIEMAIEVAGLEWASLPTGEQPAAGFSMQDAINLYEEKLSEERSGFESELKLKQGFLKQFGYGCCEDHEEDHATNEFGLVQLTKAGNPHIINNSVREDSYSYEKKDGTTSEVGQHGDDWIKPEKASAFSSALNTLRQTYPNQTVMVNDCSAYNPNENLGHSKSGGHSNGTGFDCRFLTEDGTGSTNIDSLTTKDIEINELFIELLMNTGQFSIFYADNGKFRGSTHASGHKDHLHGE